MLRGVDLISYKPFLKLLIDRDVKKKELVEKLGFSWSTLARLNKDQYVSLEVIDKLCGYLNCQPSDLIEYVLDKKEGTINE